MHHYAKLLRATLIGSLFLAALAGAAAPVAAGPSEDWQAAHDAMKRNDYATALSLFRSMAKQGYPGAQFQLGFLYRMGWGVPQDYAEALKWLRRAADQGNKLAQSNLGFMYRDGEGVPQDYVQAHMWFNLSSAASGVACRPSTVTLLQGK